MADFAEALKARLIATAGIGAEIHWVNVPQGKTPPYTRLQVISDVRPLNLKGYQDARETRVQADCFALTWGKARENANKIIAALIEPATFAGVKFGRIAAEGPRDLGENQDGVGFIHRASVDLLVWHSLA